MRVAHRHYHTIWPNLFSDLRQARVSIIDQTQLPYSFVVREIGSVAEMVNAISQMQVRGAPLIGVAAAYGMALAVAENGTDKSIESAAQQLLESRPTAVNLQWAVARCLRLLAPLPVELRAQAIWREAGLMCEEDIATNTAIGSHGLSLIADLAKKLQRPVRILTHCNAGWLATVDGGTALAPVYAAHDAGVAVSVWVDETRPRNQGWLTAWELAEHGVPHTVVTDNAGGYLMQKGLVDMVIVGADRVTPQGDVCNKIGTYLKALAAADCGIPFYVAVPSTTVDWTLACLEEVPIEMREASEVYAVRGMLANGEVGEMLLGSTHTEVANPAFDLTPARLVTGLITERGVCAPHQLKEMLCA